MTTLTLDTIRTLANNDGMTLRNGKPVVYKSGYQVATHGAELHTPETAYAAIKAFSHLSRNVGIWLENGIYYVDFCHRVPTKRQAIAEGKAHNQISVLGWKKMNLIYMAEV